MRTKDGFIIKVDKAVVDKALIGEVRESTNLPGSPQ
jgi:hypothetical protein